MNESISPSASRFGESIKLLFRWRGSIYHLLWRPVLLYFCAYISLTLLYEFVLNYDQRRIFEAVAFYCTKYTSAIPVIMLLGFFTATAMQRWFGMCNVMPGTARVIGCFTMSLREDLAEGSAMVELYSRLTLVCWVLTFQTVCTPFQKLMTNLAAIQQRGLLLEHERRWLEETDETDRFSMVFGWLTHVLRRAQRLHAFQGSQDLGKNVDALLYFKKSCAGVLKFSAKNIPLALLQAVGLTVYVFGLASLMCGRQLNERNRTVTILTGYFPVLHSMQYFLYFAWWKFGHVAANPFGEDDDDIDILHLFQRHVQNARRLTRHYAGREETVVNQSIAQHVNGSLDKIECEEHDQSEDSLPVAFL